MLEIKAQEDIDDDFVASLATLYRVKHSPSLIPQARVLHEQFNALDNQVDKIAKQLKDEEVDGLKFREHKKTIDDMNNLFSKLQN